MKSEQTADMNARRGDEPPNCPACGAATHAGSRFCQRCGFGFVEASAQRQARTATAFDPAQTRTPCDAPHEWGAMTPRAGGSTLSPNDAASLRRTEAAGGRRGRVKWLGTLVAVAIFSLGMGVAGTQLYNYRYAEGMVEIDGTMHQEFIQIGGTKFQYADGAHVVETAADSDITRAGLKTGDVIIRVDGRKVRYMEDFGEILGNSPKGKALEIIFIRDGKRLWTTLTPTTNWDMDNPSVNQLEANMKG